MKHLKHISLIAATVAMSLSTSLAYGDETIDEVARGGLHHLKIDLATTLDDMQAAIGANTTGVVDNAAAIAQNATNISNNTAGITQNASDTQANTAAIGVLQSRAALQYDYRDYSRAANVVSKTYNIRNIATCDTETRNFSSVTSGDTTDITLTRVRTESGLPCRYHVFHFRNTPQGRFRLGVDNYNGSGSRLRSTVTLDKPMIMRTSAMQIGVDIGDGTTTTFTDFDNGGVVTPGTFIQKTVLLAVDSVSVPLNGGTTFEGCLRLHVTHESTFGFGTGPIDRIEYHCPGLGMVKRIQANGGYYELTGVTYN